jgi:hypothetical protein
LDPFEDDQCGPERDRKQGREDTPLGKRVAALEDATRAMAQTREFG